MSGLGNLGERDESRVRVAIKRAYRQGVRDGAGRARARALGKVVESPDPRELEMLVDRITSDLWRYE